MEIEGAKEAGATCLIAGGGYVGTRLARQWMARQPVLALVRSVASEQNLIRAGIPALVADFDNESPVGWVPLPGAIGSVVYLVPPSGLGTEDLRLARFLGALDQARPEVLLYFSTTSVYGDTGGTPVDENSPIAPQEDRSRQRLDAEWRVARWCLDRAIRCVLFRVPAIYGPQRLPLERLRRGEPVLRAEDSGPGNRIHVDDLVDACAAALLRPVAGIFNLTDGQPESMAAFTARVAELAGLPAPRQITWAEAEEELSPGLRLFLRGTRLVTSCRAEALGWTPRYKAPGDGIRASLREMGVMIPAEDGLLPIRVQAEKDTKGWRLPL